MGSTYQSTVVPAPVEIVWEKLRDFYDMTWAPSVITQCRPVGERLSTEVGASRVLNDVFEETLLKLDDGERVLCYSIDDGPDPIGKDQVTSYRGTIRVRPVTDENHTFVEWSSEWKGNEAAVIPFCRSVYNLLLSDLKKHFEARR